MKLASIKNSFSALPSLPRSYPSESIAATSIKMASAASVSHGVSLGKHALEQHGSRSASNRNTESFAAFLDKFTEGSCSLSDMREKRAISPYIVENHGCQQSFKIIDAATIRTSIAKGEYLLYQAPTYGCDITRARPSGRSTETCVDSSALSDKDDTATNASRAINRLSKSGVVLYSSVRKLTNATYLRKMHLSSEDALGLFPEVTSTLDFVYRNKMTRHESWKPVKKGIYVHIHDIEGRRWPVLLECVRTAGQRHVHFNKGWAELCSANGLFIGKSAQLARWKEGVSPSHVALVTLSIVQAHEK